MLIFEIKIILILNTSVFPFQIIMYTISRSYYKLVLYYAIAQTLYVDMFLMKKHGIGKRQKNLIMIILFFYTLKLKSGEKTGVQTKTVYLETPCLPLQKIISTKKIKTL